MNTMITKDRLYEAMLREGTVQDRAQFEELLEAAINYGLLNRVDGDGVLPASTIETDTEGDGDSDVNN